jgi:hypothetical protein
VVLLLGVGVLVVGIGTGFAEDEGDKDEDAGAKCTSKAVGLLLLTYSPFESPSGVRKTW